MAPKTPAPGLGKTTTTAVFGAWSAAVTGVTSWAAGIAGHTWHVSVPFFAAWLVLLLVLLLTHHLTRIVSYSWHVEKGNAVAEITAKAKIAETIAESYVKQMIAAKLGGS